MQLDEEGFTVGASLTATHDKDEELNRGARL
jgi:hypothetical protein